MPQKSDDDLTLPRSTIDKILIHYKLAVPRSIRHYLTRFADQFIIETSLQANLLCEKEKKKTISHEHILMALKNRGFYFEKELLQVYEENRNISKMRPSKINKLKTSKFTLEELKMQQDKLFESARKEYENMEQPETEISDQKEKETQAMENISEDKNIDDSRNRTSNIESIDDEDSEQIGLAVDLDSLDNCEE